MNSTFFSTIRLSFYLLTFPVHSIRDSHKNDKAFQQVSIAIKKNLAAKLIGESSKNCPAHLVPYSSFKLLKTWEYSSTVKHTSRL